MLGKVLRNIRFTKSLLMICVGFVPIKKFAACLSILHQLGFLSFQLSFPDDNERWNNLPFSPIFLQLYA